MIAIIDLYCKELLKVNGFSPSTVETYELSIKAFCRFIKDELQTDLVDINGPLLLKWILHLKSTGIGHSRIEGHHYALKSFFAFLKKSGLINTNPAEALPLLITRRRQVTKPIPTRQAFKLLDSFDQNTWYGLRNYTMVSLYWALGLRTNELTGLKVSSFETGHGRRIGLLRVRGKNSAHCLLRIDYLIPWRTTWHTRSPHIKNFLPFSKVNRGLPSQTAGSSVLSKIRPKRPALKSV